MRSKTEKKNHMLYVSLSKLQVISTNSDWFIGLLAPLWFLTVIYLALVFQQSFENCSILLFKFIKTKERSYLVLAFFLLDGHLKVL